MSNSIPAETRRLVRKPEAVKVIGSKKYVERMLHASQAGSKTPWLRVVPPRPGTKRRDTLIALESVYEARERLLNGEHPPLFPSEERGDNNDHTGGQK